MAFLLSLPLQIQREVYMQVFCVLFCTKKIRGPPGGKERKKKLSAGEGGEGGVRKVVGMREKLLGKSPLFLMQGIRIF